MCVKNQEFLLEQGMKAYADHRYEDARKFYKKAAILGNVRAMYLLGCMYKSNLIKKQENGAARKWFRKAAYAGDNDAKNVLKTLKKKDNKDTIVSLSMEWGNQERKKGNLELAIKYYQTAKNAGGTEAPILLCKIYFSLGRIAWRKESYPRAEEFFQKAIENAFDPYVLCRIYLLMGKRAWENRDYVYAKDLYEKAIETGDPSGLYILGKMYQNGYGIAKDTKKATLLFEKSFDMGFWKAAKIIDVKKLFPQIHSEEKSAEAILLVFSNIIIYDIYIHSVSAKIEISATWGKNPWIIPPYHRPLPIILEKGSRLHIKAYGEDAKEAVNAIVSICIARMLGKEENSVSFIDG